MVITERELKSVTELIIKALGALTVASVRLEGTQEPLLLDDVVVRATEALCNVKKLKATGEETP